MGCLNHSHVAAAPAARTTLWTDCEVILWAPLKDAFGAMPGPKGSIAAVGIFIADGLTSQGLVLMYNFEATLNKPCADSITGKLQFY
jgi:hypothetical protein